MTLEETVREINTWANNRGINGADRQLLKITEELGELVSAYTKNHVGEIADGVGDVFIPLVAFCWIRGLDFERCVEYAWSQVRGRTGKIVNGTFIKDPGQDELPADTSTKNLFMQRSGDHVGT